MSYDEAFARLIDHEGEFQDDPEDRGNWTKGRVGEGQLLGTKYGISAMTYPTEDIKNLTLQRAKFLYKRDFWDVMRGDHLPFALAFQMFDAAVNHGPGNAIRILQRAVGVVDDGDLGPLTGAAVNRHDTDDLLMMFLAERIRFFTHISTFNRFGRGWMRRVADNLDHAAKDHTRPWHDSVQVKR